MCEGTLRSEISSGRVVAVNASRLALCPGTRGRAPPRMLRVPGFISNRVRSRFGLESRALENSRGTANKPVNAPSRLFTLVHGMTAGDIEGPLAAYQATTTNAADMAEMIRAIAKTLGGRAFQIVRNKEREALQAKVEPRLADEKAPEPQTPAADPPLPFIFREQDWKTFQRAGRTSWRFRLAI